MPYCRLARRDVHRVDQLQLALADVAEVFRVLETQRGPRRHRLAGGGLRERTVSETTAARAVDDLVILGGHLAHRHLPAIGGRGLEHGARGGATAAHRLEEMAGAARAVGVLVAELLLVTGRLGDAHSLPVGLELVGDDHRHAGPDALPHLRAMADDRDRSVLGDRDEGQRIVDPSVGHPIGAVFLGLLGAGARLEPDGQHESAERHPLQESAPAHVGQHHGLFGRRDRTRAAIHPRAHRAPAFAAACLIAARIRVYVPQRQMLPSMASSIWASVGFGLRRSSAAADMIWPAWQ